MTQREIDVVRYMQKYQKTLEKIEDTKELYERLFTQATGGGAPIDPAGFVSGGYSGDTVGNAAIMLENVEEKLKARLITKKKLEVSINKLIAMVPDEETQKVLRMTYIDGDDRRYIAREIKRSVTTVRNRHNAGISHIAKRVRITKKN